MAMPSLRVNPQHPFRLETAKGEPYFLLADTAWELFHRLTRNEISDYLQVRDEQRFTMIWAVLLAEFDGIRTPNPAGLSPFEHQDPSRPNPAYFDFVADVVAEAQGRGLYMGLLPTWGDKLTAPWGEGPRLFTENDPDTARRYGEFVGKRFKGFSNLLWVLGGDRPASIKASKDEWIRKAAKDAGFDQNTDWRPIWRAMAEGIRAEYGESALFTYHPQGGTESTSAHLQDELWLHLNAMQSGHGGGRDLPVWESIERDRKLTPPRPTFDAEPNYEDHPVSPWPTFNPSNGYFDEYDVRRQIWRSVFAGGCGVVYGHHSIWQFASDRKPWINHAKMDWRAALRRPGAEQVRHLRAFVEEFGLLDMAPAQEVFADGAGKGPEHKRALHHPATNRTVAYFPHGGAHRWAGPQGEALWFDPRSGKRLPAKIGGEATCPSDTDWALVVPR